MESPRAVVIPFGVPEGARGLGVGLAALVHAFVHVEGEAIALAQLHTRRPGDGAGPAAPPDVPVEAFVSPAAWREMAGRGDSPGSVGLVLTGSFEPPVDGSGTLRLLAYDPKDGRTCASVEAAVDGDRAGAAVVEAIESLGARLGGHVGALRGLQELGWEPLESVLMAERWALHDPARGMPHDRLAAMLHLSRAVGDAPTAKYPAERLAAIALDAAAAHVLDARLGAAAARAVERASSDAVTSSDLAEAHAALLLRLGEPREAERRLNEAVALAPERARPYSLLSQALRAQGKLDGALAALEAGRGAAGEDVMLAVERGAVLAAAGDLAGAASAWRGVLSREPVHPVAFGAAASLALRMRDAGGAQWLVDAALASRNASLDVLRGAVQLAIGSEAEGLARASRVRTLVERWLDQAPNDPAGLLVLARALLALDDARGARARIDAVLRIAPRSPAGAEALVMRMAMEAPEVDLEVQSVLRASHHASGDALAQVGARARKLATVHESWPAWLAVAIVERRRGRDAAAKQSLEIALEIAPGAAPLHFELAGAWIALGAPAQAVASAQAGLDLDGPSPHGLRVLGRAYDAAGRLRDALEVLRRALAMAPDDRETLACIERVEIQSGPSTRSRQPSWPRLTRWFSR